MQGRISGSRVEGFRGGCSSPSETEVERETMDCNIRVKTRLEPYYSYYRIVIVEGS